MTQTSCPWDVAGAKLRQALKPKRMPLPPWYRYHPVKVPTADIKPMDMAFATTGGKGLIHGLVERDENTIEAAIRRELLTRLGIIREQLARNQTIVWNKPDEAGDFYKPDLPNGIGVFAYALTAADRQALIDEADDLKQALHV